MKKILLFYILISILTYGELLSTNGEVGFFYDDDIHRIHTIKGDVFDEPIIAEIGIGVMIGKNTYLLKDYVKDVQLLVDTNILFIKSNIEGVSINTYIFPSSEERKRIYFINEFIDIPEGVNVQLLYKLSPYKDTGIVDYNSPQDYYTFEKMRFKSLNNKSGLYISGNEYLDVFKFREIRSQEVKYREDKLFFVTKIIGNNKKNYDMVAFDFSQKDWENKLLLRPVELKKEYLLWDEWNWNFKKYPKDVEAQLSHLRMLTMGDKIPSFIYYGKSTENLSSRLNLSTILSIYGKSEESTRLLEDYKFKKKNTSKDVAVLFSLFKNLGLSPKPFDNQEFLLKVYPVIMRTLMGIDSNGKFKSGEDNIELYYNLIMFMEELLQNPVAIKNISEDFVFEKLERVKNYVALNFITPEGIKDTSKSQEINPMNIKFVEIYPENSKKFLIEAQFKKYYNRRLGYLVLNGNSFMDLEYNLYFIKALYNNSFEIEGEKLYSRIREIIRKNNNYLAPKMYLKGENETGIYGNLIYLYLLTNYYRGIE
jgi:hypothetical protein